MSSLIETKKMMAIQRQINNEIFFFEFPVGQKIIKKRKNIDPLIEVVDGTTFNMMDGTVQYQGERYYLGALAVNALWVILKNRGKVVTEPDIFSQVWVNKKYKQGYVSDVIRRIKNKMGDIILLKYGEGYYLNLNHGRGIETKDLRVA